MIEQQNWLVVNVSIMMAAQNATDFMHPEEQVLVDPFSWPSAHTPDPREAFLPFETCILPSPNCTAEHSPNLSGGLCFALFLAWAFYSFFFSQIMSEVLGGGINSALETGKFLKNNERESQRERAMVFFTVFFCPAFLCAVTLIIGLTATFQRFRWAEAGKVDRAGESS